MKIIAGQLQSVLLAVLLLLLLLLLRNLLLPSPLPTLTKQLLMQAAIPVICLQSR
jgi:hypothetical protein